MVSYLHKPFWRLMVSYLLVDLFTSLMPLPVHVALQSFDGKRKDLVERQIERLREKNNLLNG